MFLRRGRIELVALFQTPPLNVDIAGDENDRTQPFMDIGFEQQRDFVDDDGKTGGALFANPLFGESPHAGVDDSFELFSRGWIVEYERAQLLPVEGLVGLQNITSKRGDDFMPRRLAGFDGFAG